MRRDGGGDGTGRPPRRVEARASAETGERAGRCVLAAPPSTGGSANAGFKGACARDFADFVECEQGQAAPPLPHPDPDFREGLRRRLWRMQVMARGERGLVRH